MDPNGIRDDAASNPQGKILKTVRSWNSLHGSSGMCTPGCTCSWEVEEPEPCGDRERRVTHIPGAAEAARAAAEAASSAAAAAEAVSRAAAAMYGGGAANAYDGPEGGAASAMAGGMAAGGRRSCATIYQEMVEGKAAVVAAVEASSGGETKPVSSGACIPPALNLVSRWSMPSTSVGGATPALWSPTFSPFTGPGLPQTGACSPDCSCPWGRRCFDSTRR